MNFRGTFEHALDAKHRLTVPAKYRATFASGMVLAAMPSSEEGAPNSLAMWLPDDFEDYTRSALAEFNPLSPTAKKLSRMLFANSIDVELDSANRVMIPQSLMEFAGLGKEVVVIGAGACLEVWDRSTYNTYNEKALAAFAEITAGFDHTA